MPATKRTFFLGDEWVYYKLYCSKRSADTVLVNAIQPLVDDLIKQKVIDQWFFIRYSDPKAHLRIRFRCTDIKNIGMIIGKVKTYLNDYLEEGIIWSLMTDTYVRELGRYGTNTIEEAESLFFNDSTYCLRALKLIEEDEQIFLFTLCSIDSLLNLFEFDWQQKVIFTKRNLQAYKREFGADKNLNKQLNLKYQALQERITQLMIDPLKGGVLWSNLLSEKEQHMSEATYRILNKVKKEQISLEDHLTSQVHMVVNRIFRDKQRLHELVCYSCLYRYYQSQNHIDTK